MSDISISRAHNRSHDDARKLAETVCAGMSRAFDMSYKWDGDTINFERSGAKGEMIVGPTDVTIHVKLGLMLRPLKGKIAEELEKNLEKALAAG